MHGLHDRSEFPRLLNVIPYRKVSEKPSYRANRATGNEVKRVGSARLKTCSTQFGKVFTQINFPFNNGGVMENE